MSNPNPFGGGQKTGAFGNQTNTSAFGVQGSTFGPNTASPFGKSNPIGGGTQPAGGAFGQANKGSSPFGQQQSTGSSPFGQQQSTNSGTQQQAKSGMGVFGAQQAGSAFGKLTGTPFGQSGTTPTPSALGQTNPPTGKAASPFGQGATTSTTSTFGQRNTPAFGQGASTTTPAFGQGTTPALGQGTTPAFGQGTTPALGQGTTTTTTFGQGSATTAPGSSPFGTFGQTSTPSQFGQATTTNKTTPTATTTPTMPVATTPTPSPFTQNAVSTTSTPKVSDPKPTNPASSPFGQPTGTTPGMSTQNTGKPQESKKPEQKAPIMASFGANNSDAGSAPSKLNFNFSDSKGEPKSGGFTLGTDTKSGGGFSLGEKKPEGGGFSLGEKKPEGGGFSLGEKKPEGRGFSLGENKPEGSGMIPNMSMNKDQKKEEKSSPGLNMSMGSTVPSQNQIELDWERSSKTCEQKVDEWKRLLNDGLKELKDLAISVTNMEESRKENKKINGNFKLLTPIVTRLSEKNSIMGYLDNIEKRQERLMNIMGNINRDLGMQSKAFTHPNSEKVKVYRELRKEYELAKGGLREGEEDPSNLQLSNIYNNLNSFEYELNRQKNILAHYFSKFIN